MARITRVVPVVGPANTGRYQFALRGAENELGDLRSKLAGLKKEETVLTERIKMLEETVSALKPLCADEGGDTNAGLTEACGQALDTVVSMTVPQIKKRLEEMGVRLKPYKNPLAVLHTTLNRMYVAGQVDKFEGNGGQKTSFRKLRD